MFWNVAVPKFNLTATTTPSASNNQSIAGGGWEPGSYWIDNSADPPNLYWCVMSDQTTAIWILICSCGTVGPPVPPGQVGGQHSSYIGNPVGATFGRP